MKKNVLGLMLAVFSVVVLSGQPREGNDPLVPVRKADHTPVKNQENTSTCWSFSTISLVESHALREGLGEFDLSEMFIVRNIYTEKARNYILRQGKAQFGPGGLGNDVINAIARYGAVPESVYSGLLLGKRSHDHSDLDTKLRLYLDSVLLKRPLAPAWMQGFQALLDDHLGRVPRSFVYDEKNYTPETFARDVLKFRKEDYVFITSFTHHPFYSSFVLEIPDNYAGESYYNIPLQEMVDMVKAAATNGYSVMWDADISNAAFRQKDGFAMHWTDPKTISRPVDPDGEEGPWDPELRQALFESLVTQDDHLMHIVGLEKSPEGKAFFLVKNSWGDVGPFDGYIKVSESYFAINTVSLVVPRAAMGDEMEKKLGLR